MFFHDVRKEIVIAVTERILFIFHVYVTPKTSVELYRHRIIKVIYKCNPATGIYVGSVHLCRLWILLKYLLLFNPNKAGNDPKVPYKNTQQCHT